MAKSVQAFPTKKDAPIDKIVSPFQRFLRYEASSGIVLIFSIVLALIWANINSSSYFGTWNTYFSISFGSFSLSKPTYLWINDLLMAIFFLLVGLEVKRELLIGELRDPKRAMLPIGAAIGGIAIPAMIYVVINYGNTETIRGWAIPAATDIAFALGILYLLGNKVPVAARVFLATLAIIDDIAAILIIALFYTGEVKFSFIILAGAAFLLLFIFNQLNIRKILPYLVVGTIMWYGFFGSGIHATIAGVFLAMTIPATTKIDHLEFRDKLSGLVDDLKEITDDEKISHDEMAIYMDTIAELEHASQDAEAPLQRFEHLLAPWVAFLIMPLFALANAGVVLSGSLLLSVTETVSLGIIFGLLVGKPLGVFVFSYVAINLGIAELPKELSLSHVTGVGFLAGIGFTMSTFISALAFETNLAVLETTKVAILIASFIAGGVGYYLLRRTNGQNQSTLTINQFSPQEITS